MRWFAKEKKKPQCIPDPGFRRAKGTHYLLFLEALQQHRKPFWYLEIGTDTGRSLRLARGNSIAIDPDFKIVGKLNHPSQLHLFQMTSDEFFATKFLERNAIRIDFSFLDGLHHFEFLLRDFMNAERNSKSESLIAMHDCVPFNRLMAERDWDREKTLSWTGDVWKMLPILRKYRPDLTVQVVDCEATGLVLVTGLDPRNTALDENYDTIIAEWLGVDNR